MQSATQPQWWKSLTGWLTTLPSCFNENFPKPPTWNHLTRFLKALHFEFDKMLWRVCPLSVQHVGSFASGLRRTFWQTTADDPSFFLRRFRWQWPKGHETSFLQPHSLGNQPLSFALYDNIYQRIINQSVNCSFIQSTIHTYNEGQFWGLSLDPSRSVALV